MQRRSNHEGICLCLSLNVCVCVCVCVHIKYQICYVQSFYNNIYFNIHTCLFSIPEITLWKASEKFFSSLAYAVRLFYHMLVVLIPMAMQAGIWSIQVFPCLFLCVFLTFFFSLLSLTECILF